MLPSRAIIALFTFFLGSQVLLCCEKPGVVIPSEHGAMRAIARIFWHLSNWSEYDVRISYSKAFSFSQFMDRLYEVICQDDASAPSNGSLLYHFVETEMRDLLRLEHSNFWSKIRRIDDSYRDLHSHFTFYAENSVDPTKMLYRMEVVARLTFLSYALVPYINPYNLVDMFYQEDAQFFKIYESQYALNDFFESPARYMDKGGPIAFLIDAQYSSDVDILRYYIIIFDAVLSTHKFLFRTIVDFRSREDTKLYNRADVFLNRTNAVAELFSSVTEKYFQADESPLRSISFFDKEPSQIFQPRTFSNDDLLVPAKNLIIRVMEAFDFSKPAVNPRILSIYSVLEVLWPKCVNPMIFNSCGYSSVTTFKKHVKSTMSPFYEIAPDAVDDFLREAGDTFYDYMVNILISHACSGKRGAEMEYRHQKLDFVTRFYFRETLLNRAFSLYLDSFSRNILEPLNVSSQHRKELIAFLELRVLTAFNEFDIEQAKKDRLPLDISTVHLLISFDQFIQILKKKFLSIDGTKKFGRKLRPIHDLCDYSADPLVEGISLARRIGDPRQVSALFSIFFSIFADAYQNSTIVSQKATLGKLCIALKKLVPCRDIPALFSSWNAVMFCVYKRRVVIDSDVPTPQDIIFWSHVKPQTPAEEVSLEEEGEEEVSSVPKLPSSASSSSKVTSANASSGGRSSKVKVRRLKRHAKETKISIDLTKRAEIRSIMLKLQRQQEYLEVMFHVPMSLPGFPNFDLGKDQDLALAEANLWMQSMTAILDTCRLVEK